MASDERKPNDLTRFHFAVHDGALDGCPECRDSTVEGACNAPIELLESLSTLAESVAIYSCDPESPDYRLLLTELVPAALAYGKALEDWRALWEYGNHVCGGAECFHCRSMAEHPTWEPVELMCIVHPECSYTTYHPAWLRETWEKVLRYLRLNGVCPIPDHLMERHKTSTDNGGQEG